MILNQAVAIENTSEVENKITGTLGDISDLSDRIANAQDSSGCSLYQASDFVSLQPDKTKMPDMTHKVNTGFNMLTSL